VIHGTTRHFCGVGQIGIRPPPKRIESRSLKALALPRCSILGQGCREDCPKRSLQGHAQMAFDLHGISLSPLVMLMKPTDF